MEQLDGIIQTATRKIEAPYFLLPIAGGSPVSRERVYCYEFYHQMRSAWPGPEITPLIINGEVDKRAHQGMQALGVGNQIPDLLVHLPGDMGGNHAIIEIKPSKAKPSGIRKDLKTFAIFRAGPRYERGIYLIYGATANDHFVNRIRREAANIEGTRGIEIWLHPHVGVSAQRVAFLD